MTNKGKAARLSKTRSVDAVKATNAYLNNADSLGDGYRRDRFEYMDDYERETYRRSVSYGRARGQM